MRLAIVVADLSSADPAVLRSAVHGADAVLSALGPRNSGEYGNASTGTADRPGTVGHSVAIAY